MPEESKLQILEREVGCLSTQNEKGLFLRELYDRLVHGEAYDWDGHDLFEVERLLEENGLKTEAERIGMHHNAVLKRDPVEDYEFVERKMPPYFAREVKRGAILSRDEMEWLAAASKEVIFDRLFNHFTSFGLGILPEYASAPIRELESELLRAMQSYEEVRDVQKLRENLGERAKIRELQKFGADVYTRVERDLDDEMPTGGIEFKVAKAIPLEGQRFMVRRVSGYYGILRYYAEEMARIAPKDANAFLDGTAILRSVYFCGMESPLSAGTILRPINQPDDQYHIVPVKFFHVETDTTKKYELGSEEVAWASDGKAYGWRDVVRPRGEATIVSRSETALFVSG